MKIRAGFVSNSSTSSFIIYGAYIEEDDLDITKEQRAGFTGTWGFALEEFVEGLLEDSWVSIEYGPDWVSGVYVGRDVSACPDDMTMSKFKQRIEDSIREHFGSKLKCRIHKEAWRDG